MVRAAYDRQAACFIPKPSNDEGYGRLVHAINNFWLNVVLLPRAPYSG